LALFLLDSRQGITGNDVALYKWMTQHNLKMKERKKSAEEAEADKMQKSVWNTQKSNSKRPENVEDITMPPILYLANKAEDAFEGDIHADFYLKFPGI